MASVKHRFVDSSSDAAAVGLTGSGPVVRPSHWNDEHEVVLVKADVGLSAVDNTADSAKPVSTAQATALAAKADSSALAAKADASALTSHTSNTSNPHSVTKAQVGLGSVDNTSDAAKPVSTAQATALAAKADSSALTSHTGNTSNPHSVTKAQVGLGSVDNTADSAKPVSTAAQAALDAKSPIVRSRNAQTGTTYTLVLGDAGNVVSMNNGSANTLTVPPNSSVAFPAGTQVDLAQLGAGQTTIAAGGGVTIRSDAGKLKLSGQYVGATLLKLATDEWLLAGSIAA